MPTTTLETAAPAKVKRATQKRPESLGQPYQYSGGEPASDRRVRPEEMRAGWLRTRELTQPQALLSPTDLAAARARLGLGAGSPITPDMVADARRRFGFDGNGGNGGGGGGGEGPPGGQEDDPGNLRRSSAEAVVERKVNELIQAREYRIAGVIPLPYEKARDINRPELLKRNEGREALPAKDQEKLPAYDLVIAGLERYYRLTPEQQMTSREMAIYNSFCRDYREYMQAQETVEGLLPIKREIEDLGREFGVTRFLRPDGKGGTVEVADHDLQSRIDIVREAIEQNQSQGNYWKIREDMNGLWARILDVRYQKGELETKEAREKRWAALPERQRNWLIEVNRKYDELKKKEMRPDRVEDLKILRQVLEGLNQTDPRIAQINNLITNHEQQPMFALIQLQEEAYEIYEDMRSGEHSEAAEEDLVVPDRSFAEAMAILESSDPSITPEAQAEAAAEVETYLRLARRVGLLVSTERDLDTTLKKYLNQMNGSGGETLRFVSDIVTELEDGDKILDNSPLPFANDEATQMSRFIKRKKGTTSVEIDGQMVSLDQFNGVIAYNLRQGHRSIYEHFERIDSGLKVDLKVTKGAWSAEESERRQYPQREFKLWEVTGAGYYIVNARSFDEVRTAIRSISKYFRSGAIRKDAQTLLGELEYLNKAIMGTEGNIPLDLPERLRNKDESELTHNEIKQKRKAESKRQEELVELRREFYIENLAYLCELFNRIYNGQYLAAIYAKMNDPSEAMDNWALTSKLHGGKVHLASIIDEEPDSELRYRMKGRHGQFYHYTNAELVLHKDERESMAKKMVGELISDRHVERNGNYFEGNEGAKKNLAMLGVDQAVDAVGAIMNSSEIEQLKRRIAAGEKLSEKEKLRYDQLTRLDRAYRTGLLNPNARYVADTATLLKMQESGIILTKNERLALTLRQVKLLKAEGITKPRNDREKEAFELYDEALEESREAVQVYMQFNSMSGDKTERGAPALQCNPLDENGKRVYDSLKVRTSDEVPLPWGESLVMFALNMADIQVAQYNKRIEDQIEAAIGAGRNDLVEALVDRLITRSLPGGKANPKYVDFLAQVRDQAILTLFKNGWKVGLTNDGTLFELDLDSGKLVQVLDENGNVKVGKDGKPETRFLFAKSNKKVIDPHNGNKPVTLLSASQSVFGRHMETTYPANQKEIQDQICSKRIYDQAVLLRAGKLRPDQVDILAVQRLIIDPTLTRIPTYDDDGICIAGPEIGRAQQNGKEVYIAAACEESYLRYILDARKQLSIVFDDLTEFGIPNFDGATKRLFYPQALGASNSSRWAHRGRWFTARIYASTNSMKAMFGLKKFLDQTKLIRRKDDEKRKVDQENTDPPIISAHAQSYQNGVDQHSRMHGNVGEGKSEPGVFEKVFAELEKIMDETTLADARGEGLKFKNTENQQRFWSAFESTMVRVKALMDPGLSVLSKTATGEEAWDLRNTDFYTYVYNEKTRAWKRKPAFYINKETLEPIGTRIPRSHVGRARNLSDPLVDDVITYMESHGLVTGVSVLNYLLGKDEQAEVALLQGAQIEYDGQSAWLRIMNTKIKVDLLTVEDRKYIDPDKHEITLGQLWKAKMARR